MIQGKAMILLASMLMLGACGGGSSNAGNAQGSGGDQSPSQPPTSIPDGQTPPGNEQEKPLTYPQMSVAQASRLLHQGTMGPTGAEISAASKLSAHAWIHDQFSQPITYHLPLLKLSPGKDQASYSNRIDTWWRASLSSPDQLRQRVAFALSQIFVVSDTGNNLRSRPEGMLNYYDLLLKHSFGNYRDLLQAVTLSPVMGTYLSHLGNEKANVELNIRPDENYAREVMQLFTIGLEELNLDGTPKRDSNGNTIATYDQTQIEGFARIFTGWTFAESTKWKYPNKDYLNPMQVWPEYHSELEKTLLNGTVVAANEGPENALKLALDNLFQNDNVGPFIGKQLIQRLTTSNPSADYIARVSQVFNDNGSGVRGDLKAVVYAILMDQEARDLSQAPEHFGKLKEPLLQTAQLWRELNAYSQSGYFYTWDLASTHGQVPLGSPSVFNFYRPDYQPLSLAGTELVAPEAQIANSATSIGLLNYHYSSLVWRIASTKDQTAGNQILVDLSPHAQIVEQEGKAALVEYYNQVFLSKQMSDELRQELLSVFDWAAKYDLEYQIAYCLFLLVVSPEYVHQR
ncbi:DUF1800 domain-containing protein [Motilimonas cestriensis]|uniref:DUF1800 domain-containing protein n=1 Tax=Motilimonas cestriensis TaxID=2742685 RepID=A0ABS8WE10_9GAMM|nr:DUF1800 domain-containing protein [Motilimonas cestriensis]MCE2596803.1 DUF1800 domain-containing protein [Motilimonas cestriensis]